MSQTPDSIPIASLQHMAFCPRQCALIHLEMIWEENGLTALGRILHERADSGGMERIKGRKIVRSVHLSSEKYGIHGIADVVEYVRNKEKGWIPYPVEYKRGKPKEGKEDEIQLCAQALCLEEMHQVSIESGSLYYGKTKRRMDVAIDDSLRALTQETILKLKELMLIGKTPSAEYSSRCERCSLKNACLPEAARLQRGVSAWNNRNMEASLSAQEMEDDFL